MPRKLWCCIFAALFTVGAVAQQPSPTRHDSSYVDYDKLYARPTVTVVAPVTSRPGYPPVLHIYIQFRSMQYVCMPLHKNLQLKGLQVGMTVELRESGKYLYVRHDRERWVQFRLLQKEELHNL